MPIPHSVIGLVTSDREVQVDRSQLLLFAKATGITTSQHVEVDAARASGQPDLLVPPTFLFGLELMQPEPFAWLERIGVDLRTVLHGSQSFVFHAPAYAGDVLRVRAIVTNVEQKKGGLLELIDRETEVSRKGDPVATLRQTIIIRPGQKTA